MIRIIGGSARGKLIRAPGGDVRPATARLRRSLFDTIAGFVTGARVLDLFSGAGGLGLEALSRGAGSAVFVDISSRSLDAARANADILGFTAQCRFIHRDVYKFLAQFTPAEIDGRRNLVFAAPPYRIADPSATIAALADCAILAAESLIVLEYDRHTPPTVAPNEIFQLYRRRTFGETVLEIWDYRSEESEES